LLLALASPRAVEPDTVKRRAWRRYRSVISRVGLPMFRPRPLWFLEPLLRREVDQPFFPLAYRDHGDHKHFVMHLVDEAEA